MSFGSSDTQDVPAATDAGQVSVGVTGPLSPTGIKAMQGDAGAEPAEQVNTDTPTRFGTFAHEAYGIAAEEKYGERAAIERRVGVTRPDGTLVEGEVDLIVDNALIDYKTGDMRNWTINQAQAAAHEHGQQMKEYVDSPDTPADAKGWIIATVPPDSLEVRQAYAAGLNEYDVDVKFATSEDQASVMRAVDQAVKDTPSLRRRSN